MLRKRDGFTFVELAVVMIILGIMMSVTMPRFTSTLSRATLGGTARHLAGVMAYLRSTAAKNARSYFLTIDLDKNEYSAAVLKEESDLGYVDFRVYQGPDLLDEELYTEFSDDFVSKTKLQKRIIFAQVLLWDGSLVLEGKVRIEFRPDGTADETAIYLTNPRERIYTVHLEHYNGQARVYKYVFEPEAPPQLTEREPARRSNDRL